MYFNKVAAVATLFVYTINIRKNMFFHMNYIFYIGKCESSYRVCSNQLTSDTYKGVHRLNEIDGAIIALLLFSFYILLLYGMPIILIIVGYFIFKGYKKRRGVRTIDNPVAPDGKQANIKP